jgi:hypothetical protein
LKLIPDLTLLMDEEPALLVYSTRFIFASDSLLAGFGACACETPFNRFSTSDASSLATATTGACALVGMSTDLDVVRLVELLDALFD